MYINPYIHIDALYLFNYFNRQVCVGVWVALPCYFSLRHGSVPLLSSLNDLLLCESFSFVEVLLDVVIIILLRTLKCELRKTPNNYANLLGNLLPPLEAITFTFNAFLNVFNVVQFQKPKQNKYNRNPSESQITNNWRFLQKGGNRRES